jgi:hypothetical protein
VTYRPLRIVPAQAAIQSLLIPSANRDPLAADGRLSLPFLPAGTYRVQASGPVTGTVSVWAGRSPSPIYRVAVRSAPANTVTAFSLPVDTRSLVVEAEGPPPEPKRRLFLQPLTVTGAEARLAEGPAWQSGRFGVTTAYALDHRAWFETAGIWVSGSSDTTLVLQPDVGIQRLPVLVRNGAVSNECGLEMDARREALRMNPGEVRRVDLSAMTGGRPIVLRLHSSSGFRPRDIDPGSQDSRWLGCWIAFGRP